MSLREGLAWAMQARGLPPARVVDRCSHDRSVIYRTLRGDVTDIRTDTLRDLCRALRVSPTVLLQQSGLWPASTPPADGMDSALLRLLPRLEALPPAHKQWALAVVQALLAGAPSLTMPGSVAGDDASSSRDG